MKGARETYVTTRDTSQALGLFFSYIIVANKYNTYKSRGLGQAKPGPSRDWRLWLGLRFEKAKAGAFRPSQARQITRV